jgi:hypothetical protein
VAGSLSRLAGAERLLLDRMDRKVSRADSVHRDVGAVASRGVRLHLRTAGRHSEPGPFLYGVRGRGRAVQRRAAGAPGAARTGHRFTESHRVARADERGHSGHLSRLLRLVELGTLSARHRDRDGNRAGRPGPARAGRVRAAHHQAGVGGRRRVGPARPRHRLDLHQHRRDPALGRDGLRARSSGRRRHRGRRTGSDLS